MAFVDVDWEVDTDALVDQAILDLQTKFPGWELADGQVEAHLLEACARILGELAQILTQIPATVFAAFSTRFLSITQDPGAAATMTSTWTVIDSSGWVIPAGTLVVHRTSGDTGDTFATVTDVTITSGHTTAAGVPLVAVDVGAGANAIPVSTALELVESLAYVTSVVSTTISTGGQDVETDTSYLDRAAREATLLTPRPILPGDFAVLASKVTGVERALGISGYNPTDNTDGNERYVAVALVDAAGAAVTTGVKNDVVAYLNAFREINFVVKAFNPTITTVAIDYTIRVETGHAGVDVLAACTAAVTQYLQPYNWAGGDESPATWRAGENVVRLFAVSALLAQVSGVSYVASLTINGTAADLTLSGKAPLPTPGAITGAVV